MAQAADTARPAERSYDRRAAFGSRQALALTGRETNVWVSAPSIVPAWAMVADAHRSRYGQQAESVADGTLLQEWKE